MSNFRFRDYQITLIEKGVEQLYIKGWCYLSMEVRTGKTFTSLGIADKSRCNRVLFITKKKAIESVENDIKTLDSDIINVDVINYESLHKIEDTTIYDCYIIDEAHRLGGFPKPSKTVKQLIDIIRIQDKVIFLSGTPTPESNSQIFHQMKILGNKSPFKDTSFYKWAGRWCTIKEKYFGHGYPVKDYSHCNFKISDLDFISYSQNQAGFKNVIIEHFVKLKMKPITKTIIETLKKDKVFIGTNNFILADTSVKEMQKIHQLSSGTCILDDPRESITIDTTKVEYIKNAFKNKKIAIFYKFKQELEMLKEHLDITENLEEFNNNDKSIALQFVSGREGIKLDKAECIVAINIDFSATTYFQFRDRMTTIDRMYSDVFYIVSDCGIEMQVYKAVSKKKNYTLQYYKK